MKLDKDVKYVYVNWVYRKTHASSAFEGMEIAKEIPDQLLNGISSSLKNYLKLANKKICPGCIFGAFEWVVKWGIPFENTCQEQLAAALFMEARSRPSDDVDSDTLRLIAYNILKLCGHNNKLPDFSYVKNITNNKEIVKDTIDCLLQGWAEDHSDVKINDTVYFYGVHKWSRYKIPIPVNPFSKFKPVFGLKCNVLRVDANNLGVIRYLLVPYKKDGDLGKRTLVAMRSEIMKGQ